jgi:peptidoglycan hydrolase-like protein with peptidoglycan-binding domain
LERDLSRPDIWEQSLERSRARRERTGGRFARPAAAASGGGALRDLADPELWDLSRVRSRTRHDAPDPTFAFPARGASIAALLAVTGGSAAAIASSVGGGGGKAATAASPKPRRDSAPVAAVPIEHGRPAPVAETPAPVHRGGPAVVPTAATITAKPRRAGGVPELQRALGVPVDGDFGPTTQKALKRWQRAHGLTADGVAGPQTRTALDLGAGAVLKRQGAGRHAARAHTRTHRTKPAVVAAKAAPRRAGGGVRALQQALGVPADGVFGPTTQHALRRWQRAHGLTADGVAGPQTRSALDLGPGPVLKRKAVPHRHASGGGSGGGGGGSGSSSVVARVIAAANAIAGRPYVYGGGHGSFNSTGYDCSGSVSYALHGGGLLSAPLTSGAFMSYGAPGPGQHITIYANPGHVYMTIDGRRYDTSARSETGSRWSGTQRSSAGYVVRHPPGY